ncbi:MAG: ABC transporter permease [Rhodospirillaceae bacterium]
MSSIAFRFALRELRGGMRGFRIFLACIIIGVAAIAGAASLNQSVKAGIQADARPLLGGDLQIDNDTTVATGEQLAALRAGGDVTHLTQMRSMARVENEAGEVGSRGLIELKAVDGLYPLYGALTLAPMMPLGEALAEKDGLFGAAIEPALMPRLKVNVGDVIKIGEAAFQVRAAITHEPDRSISFTTIGPRVLISHEALAATQLVQPGSLIEHEYNIRVTGSKTADAVRADLEAQFPNAGWRIRGLDRAAAGLDRFLDNVTLFLTLVGLTALLTGGIGVANAVRAHLLGRLNTIATLKCLGAPADTIFAIYLIQLSFLAAVGIVIGLLIGALIPFGAAQALGDALPVAAKFGLYPAALLQAGVFGILTAALFALWPLARARDIPPVALFRNVLADEGRWPRGKYMAAIVLVGLALAAFTVATAERKMYAAAFVGGSAVAMVLFSFAARGVMRFAARMTQGRNSPTAGRPSLRLAFANLYRPGSPTMSVVLSLGLGLSVLVAIALLESNLNKQLADGLPSDAPSMFFVDIQPNQEEEFRKIVTDMPGVNKVLTAAMIRARVTQVNGIPSEEYMKTHGESWLLRGDRGITYSETLPENARLAAGAWWPAGYEGEFLASLDASGAEAGDLKLGDTITVQVLGRDVTAKIASLRDISWQSGAMNFGIILSPNALRGAPAMFLATANTDPGTEEKIETAVLNALPNVTVVQVRAALETLKNVLGTLSIAVRLTAGVALVAGALVLAGAIAAGHSRRIYESVVLKVLGATRADVLKAFVFEYLLLGLATGLIAAVVGGLAAFGVVHELMEIKWSLDLTVIATVIAACIGVTLFAGFTGTWRAMGIKAAPLLRNE